MNESKAKRIRDTITDALNASALVGAPPVLAQTVAELMRLGFEVSARTIGRGKSKGWRVEVRPGSRP